MTRRKREITGLSNERDFPHLVELTFPPGGFRSEVVRESGRYSIMTPNGPLWSNIDERGVDPALNYLFGKRKQEHSGQ
jgi:hypothetical protein